MKFYKLTAAPRYYSRCCRGLHKGGRVNSAFGWSLPLSNRRQHILTQKDKAIC